MSFNPKCPTCNVEIDFYEHYDLEDDGAEIYAKASGCCPKCGKDYKWEEHFAFIGFFNLEEIS